jgi:DNA-binding LacI/PurR family transcriptional regulator
MSDNRRFTMHDVANRAGVSYQTVSRVINHHPHVAQDTRERVLHVIAELGYRPNRAAQLLAGNHSRVLGMTTFALNQYGPAQMVISVEQAAREAGYDLIFANVTDTALESVQAAIHHLLHWEVDGLVFLAPLTGMTPEDLRMLCGDVPLVQIGASGGDGASSAAVDQAHGGRLIAQHLMGLGHTRLAEIRGPAAWVDAQARHQSLLDVLAEAGLEPTASEAGDWTPRSGYEAARALLAKGAAFTALVAGNDQMALGALRALNEAGRRVPQDVSLVGFDDIPEAAYFDPPLTTIRQDFEQLGRQGVAYMIERIANPGAAAQHSRVLPRLIERTSSAVVTR